MFIGFEKKLHLNSEQNMYTRVTCWQGLYSLDGEWGFLILWVIVLLQNQEKGKQQIDVSLD